MPLYDITVNYTILRHKTKRCFARDRRHAEEIANKMNYKIEQRDDYYNSSLSWQKVEEETNNAK